MGASDLVDRFFGSNGFLPHGHCYLWQPDLLWLSVISDSLITLSYYSIPVALVYFVYTRKDLAFRWMFVMFGFFILACGTTHLMNVWTVWAPLYWLDASIKAVTAVASVITAVLLWPLIPRALELPSPGQLQQVNEQLEAQSYKLMQSNEALRAEIAEREQAEAEIRRLNEELELKVSERTRELLEAQEELIRKEKLSVLGQIAGSVGHEIRNPLGVIKNAIFYLKMVLSAADNNTKEYLDIIREEVDISEQIVADLLDFARTKTPQKRPVNLKALLTKCLEKNKIPGAVTVLDEIQESLPAVYADPVQLGQVFMNLLKNAVEAMPSGGFLSLKAEEIHQSQELRVVIADTGQGISSEGMSRLFHPLYTTKAKGLGLGLTIVKNLTEANGGSIKVESEPGKGTVVTVKLPVVKEGHGEQ
ncbi:MAG: hypothetical protein HYS21_09505 [Deltaproteobacteria bacterium]|nr:hypothetical protein [Deltaproteobacteria bacterium]